MPAIPRDELVERLRNFVLDNFPIAVSEELKEDTSLLESGIVDSMGVLNILVFLGDEFGIPVEEVDLSAENFATVGAIANIVWSHVGAQHE